MESILEKDFFNGFINTCDLCCSLGWNERNGGNMSYRMRAQEVESVRDEFTFDRPWTPIGITAENLKNEYFLVTGSGKFFRNTKACPEDSVAITEIDEKGENYRIVWGLKNGGVPTSEFATHLINHNAKKASTGGSHRIILHSHPANIVALTFVLPLDTKVFTRELWEMMTECAIVFPHGVGVLPWMVPGGSEIAYATVELIKKHDIVVWSHHGIMCSGDTFDNAFGLMETVEKAAELLVKVLSMGGKKQAITPPQLLSLAEPYNVDIDGSLLD